MSFNTTIGQYAILSKIGEGGMGVVYRTRDTKLNRDVATWRLRLWPHWPASWLLS
jgi:hypothetical protein